VSLRYFGAVFISLLVFAGCNSGASYQPDIIVRPSPTFQPLPSPTPTRTVVPMPSPTFRPLPSPSPSPSATPKG